MGSITQGVLGGLEIANRRRETDLQAKQQQTANTFAVLQVLQHNQDRLDDLHKESADIQATRAQLAAEEATASRNYNLATQGGTQVEIEDALNIYNARKAMREQAEVRLHDLASRQDTIRNQSDQLSSFMSNLGVMHDIAQGQQVAQQLQQSAGGGGQSFEQPSMALPSDQQDQPPAPAATKAPTAAPASTESPQRRDFQLAEAKKISPKAHLDENGAIVVDAETPEELSQLSKKKEDYRIRTGVGLDLVINDASAREAKQALTEDRQARKEVHEAAVAEQKATSALETAAPKLEAAGMSADVGRDGRLKIHSPSQLGDFKADFQQDVTDKEGKVTGRAPVSPDQAADALEAVAESASKDKGAAQHAASDLGAGIASYLQGLESKGDVKKNPKGEYVVNIFGSSPDSVARIKHSVDRIGNAAGTKNLPKIVMPDPGTAVFQWTQYATPKQAAKEEPGSEPSTGPKNDAQKLLGYLKGYSQPEGAINPESLSSATLSPRDSMRVAAALAHPAGINVISLKNDRRFRDELLKIISPGTRDLVNRAIDQF